uniref:Helix-turn-helix domain-containing protein n=1 Tax=Acrobeloides nanus TaxID=290746 RepID=A0A914CHA5_9BILA
MHQRGIPKLDISRLLNIPLTTVFKDIKRYEKTGTNEDRPGRSRKRTSRTPMANKLGISKNSAHRIFREDLGLKPFKFKKR